MPKFLKKLHLPAVGSLLGSVFGLSQLVAQHQDVQGAIPLVIHDQNTAAAIVAVCLAIQAVTKAIHKGDTVEVPSTS